LPEVADRLDRDDAGDDRCDVGADAGRWAGCPVHDRDHHQDHRDHRRDAVLREHRRDAGRNRPDDHRGACSNQAAVEPSQEAAE
jgi:hypothetical protein